MHIPQFGVVPWGTQNFPFSSSPWVGNGKVGKCGWVYDLIHELVIKTFT